MLRLFCFNIANRWREWRNARASLYVRTFGNARGYDNVETE